MGDPIAHSLSPAMHNAAIAALGLDATYVALRTTHKAFPGLVHELLENGGGCSVTRPFKDDAFALEGELTDVARRTRAVNCISGRATTRVAPTQWATTGGAPTLDNTDVVGVIGAVRELLGDEPVRVARIFGTGGAARAAAIALEGATLEVASRSPERAREFAAWGASEGITIGTEPDVMTEIDLQVWATPEDLVTHPYPIRTPGTRATYDPPPPAPILDMNYRREGTSLMKLKAMQPGLRAIDGRAMLLHQGVAAFERFFGVTPPIDVMRKAVEDALRA